MAIGSARVNRQTNSATRERILAAALELFAKHGFNATSVRMIAERAGVTDPALYYYFPTKRELHAALLVAPETGDLPPPRVSREQAIDAFVGFFMRYAEQSEVFRAAMHEQMSGDLPAGKFREEQECRFRAFARPYCEEHFGERARDVESLLLYVLSGFYWDGCLRFGTSFRAVSAEDSFQTRLRGLIDAILPETA